MLYRRYLVSLTLIIWSGLFFVHDAFATCSAGTSTACDNEGEAWVLAAGAAAYWDGVTGGSYCHVETFVMAVGARLSNNTTPCNNEYQKNTWSYLEDCDQQPTKNASGDTGGIPASICSVGCEYTPDGGIDAGTWWVSEYSPTGAGCDSGVDVADAPDGCTLVAGVVVCDCTTNPEASFCSGGVNEDECTDNGDGTVTCTGTAPDPVPDPVDPNDSGGSDGGSSGGNDGSSSDGDPDTPNDPGEGDGDVDGDGDRDIDCDPSSNADCSYTGSASASSVCGVVPACINISPADCAQLIQQYNIMCAVLKDKNGGIEDRLDIIAESLVNDELYTEPFDIDAAILQEATDKATITEVGGQNWVLTEDEDGHILIEKESDFQSGFDAMFPPLGGACPNLEATNALGQVYIIDTSKWDSTFRAMMTFVLWVSVFVYSWFLFFRWGMT